MKIHSILQIAGFAVVALGISAWSIPAGIVFAGIASVVIGIALERK